MADLTTYLLITLCVFWFVYWLKNQTRGSGKKYPRGPFGLPVVGHLPFFGRNPPKTLLRWWKQYGDVFSIALGSWPTVVVNGYSTIKEAGNHPKDAFSGRPDFISGRIIKEEIGDDVIAFMNFSPLYQRCQKLGSKVSKLFSTGKPEVAEDILSSEAALCVDQMLKKYGTIPGDISSDIKLCVMRFMYQLMYGREKDINGDQHSKTMTTFFQHMDELGRSGSAVDVIPWLRYIMPSTYTPFRKLLKKLHSIQVEQVQEHIDTFSPDDIRDMTYALIASGADESNKDYLEMPRRRLLAFMTQMFAGGFHPISTVLLWVLLYMTAYPDIQEKVHKELDIELKGRQVSLKDKNVLTFTEAVILEVQRFVSPVPVTPPHLAILDAKIGDLDIDKGTVVIYNLHSVHHDEHYWGDPECFRPERFINSDNTLDTAKCLHVIPFGQGRRRCTGECMARVSIFMVFATIMQRCDFIKPSGEKLDLTPTYGQVYQPKDFRVLVKERV